MSDKEEHFESELKFQDNSELTETNNKRVGESDNEGSSQEEIETFVKRFLKATGKLVTSFFHCF